MIAMKKVSVIIPMHNAEKTIKRALDSLMNQSYANIEVVVVNNNSTDKSINIAKTYLNKLELKLLNEKNSGPSYARNSGIENSSGEYIMFLDADDYFEKDMVHEMVSAVKNNDLVCCNKYKVNNQKKTFEKFQNESIKSYGYIGLLEYMQKHAVFNTVWNKIYKKSIIIKNKIRFNTSMKVSEDYNFNIDYYRYVKSAVVINAPLYNYVISSSSITASYNLDEFEMRVKAVDNNLSLYKDKNYIAVYPMKFYIEALVQSVSKQLNAKATVDKEKLRQDVMAVWNKIMNCKGNCFSTDEKILFQIIKMENLNLIVLYINLRNFMKKVLYSVKGNIYR